MKLENIVSDHDSRTQYIVQEVAMDLSRLSLAVPFACYHKVATYPSCTYDEI